jgi:sulfate transport system ATP-binding protein
MTIEVRGVSKRFGSAVALDNVDLDVPVGSLTALLGPSGGGKSTLLRVIAGLETPDSGRVFIDGEDVTRLPPRERGIGFCFQHYAPFRHMTVWDNVAFGLKVRHWSKADTQRRVTELLELVRLEGLAKRYPSQLSGGQRQRMALARALAVEPRVLLLDEPFGALDAKVRKELRAWLRRLHDEVHITTVLVTHDQEEAMEVADRLAVINLGRLEQVGSPSELYDHPVNDFVLTFVGPVTSIGGTYVRPHSVEVHRDATRDGAHAATVDRVTSLGFEVRIELTLEDGGRTWVQLDRASAKAVDAQVGERVYLSPDPEAQVSEATPQPAAL